MDFFSLSSVIFSVTNNFTSLFLHGTITIELKNVLKKDPLILGNKNEISESLRNQIVEAYKLFEHNGCIVTIIVHNLLRKADKVLTKDLSTSQHIGISVVLKTFVFNKRIEELRMKPICVKILHD